MLTSDQIQRVRETANQLLSQQDAFAEQFYVNLFAAEPSFHDLFQNNLMEQGHEFMRVILLVVNHLNSLSPIHRSLRELGMRHNAYGVEPEYYAVAEQALVQTLREYLADGFDADTETA